MPIDHYYNRSETNSSSPQLSDQSPDHNSALEITYISNNQLSSYSSFTISIPPLNSHVYDDNVQDDEDDEDDDELGRFDYPLDADDIRLFLNSRSYSSVETVVNDPSGHRSIDGLQAQQSRIRRRYAVYGHRSSQYPAEQNHQPHYTTTATIVSSPIAYDPPESLLSLHTNEESGFSYQDDQSGGGYNRYYMDNDIDDVHFSNGLPFITLEQSGGDNTLSVADTPTDTTTSDALGLGWSYQAVQYPHQSSRRASRLISDSSNQVLFTALDPTYREGPVLRERLLFLSDYFMNMDILCQPNLSSDQSFEPDCDLPRSIVDIPATVLDRHVDHLGTYQSSDIQSQSAVTLFQSQNNQQTLHNHSFSDPVLNTPVSPTSDHLPYSPFVSSLNTPLSSFIDSIAKFPLSTVFCACFEAQLEKLQALLLDSNGNLLPFSQIKHIRPNDITDSIDDLAHLEYSINQLRNIPHFGRQNTKPTYRSWIIISRLVTMLFHK
ncbi:hypothetical protein BDEG_26937 [Batrachochytrium dendrobatidis JEL423]|uniref:Uncharacterized protein n=1 Tax=Batrachochytrium dendrobatidis (strain JEL423) TaxID=403673 RepID=A0A177WUM6_BATDL|nr:hypothetical protein BDEG_26937 [Batrachochytrium dendrobatidis JEL423]